MLTVPTIIDRAPQPYVAVRRTLTMAELGSVVGPTTDTVIDFLSGVGAEIGTTFIKYNYIDMESTMELEFGAFVSTVPALSGELIGGELPAGRYATLTHTGPYDELYSVTSMLVGWAKERGVEWDSQPEGPGERFVSRVELYLNDPADTPPAELVTRLEFKLR